MDTKAGRKITLSIDTAVNGGSISILENGIEIDSRIGETKISKAEEVLEQIEILFERNSIKKNRVVQIIVSEGPGSVTGIKIGFSLAKGLARAFKCAWYGTSVMNALLLKANLAVKGKVLTAVPIGNNLIAWQSFEFEGLGTFENLNFPQTTVYEQFFTELQSGKYRQAIMHQTVFGSFAFNRSQIKDVDIIDAGMNMAFLAGSLKTNQNASDNV